MTTKTPTAKKADPKKPGPFAGITKSISDLGNRILGEFEDLRADIHGQRKGIMGELHAMRTDHAKEIDRLRRMVEDAEKYRDGLVATVAEKDRTIASLERDLSRALGYIDRTNERPGRMHVKGPSDEFDFSDRRSFAEILDRSVQEPGPKLEGEPDLGR